MKKGVVVLGHGSSMVMDEANQVLLQLAGIVWEKINQENLRVDFFAPAFMNPKAQRQNLEQVVAEMVQKGAEEVIVAPVFLTHGRHTQEDIPAEIKRLKEKYRVEIKTASHLGADPRIGEIILERIKEVI